jgi:hypothetical protein
VNAQLQGLLPRKTPQRSGYSRGRLPCRCTRSEGTGRGHGSPARGTAAAGGPAVADGELSLSAAARACRHGFPARPGTYRMETSSSRNAHVGGLWQELPQSPPPRASHARGEANQQKARDYRGQTMLLGRNEFPDVMIARHAGRVIRSSRIPGFTHDDPGPGGGRGRDNRRSR